QRHGVPHLHPDGVPPPRRRPLLHARLPARGLHPGGDRLGGGQLDAVAPPPPPSGAPAGDARRRESVRAVARHGCCVKLAVAAGALALVATAAAGGGFPAATFTATVSGKSPRFLNGPWRLTFAPGGRYTTEHPPDEVVARGRIAVSGGTVTFGRETGSVA